MISAPIMKSDSTPAATPTPTTTSGPTSSPTLTPSVQMAQALRSANFGLATQLAKSHAHTAVITTPVTSSGLLPIHLSSLLGKPSLTHALLQAGAHVDTTAIKLAASHNHAEVLEHLLRHADESVLRTAGVAVFEAAFANACATVMQLVEAGVSVAYCGFDGATPLHYAAVGGDVSLVNCLLSAGASPLATCRRGYTALQWARLVGHTAVVRHFENRAAKRDVDVVVRRDPEERHLETEKEEAMKDIMLSKGMSVSDVGDDLVTPESFADQGDDHCDAMKEESFVVTGTSPRTVASIGPRISRTGC